MKTKTFIIWTMTALTVLAPVTGAYAQRAGGMDSGSILRHYLISNGPEGPIHGGESAVTDMILMDDGWVYGSTEATWGADACHLFRTDGEVSEHVVDVSSEISGQPKVSDMDIGPKGELYIEMPTEHQLRMIYSK